MVFLPFANNIFDSNENITAETETLPPEALITSPPKVRLNFTIKSFMFDTKMAPEIVYLLESFCFYVLQAF